MKKQKNIEIYFAIQELLPYPRIWRVNFAEFQIKNAHLQRAVHQPGAANKNVLKETHELLLALWMQCGDSSKLLGNVYEYLVGCSLKFGFSGLTKK
jgi:hypothetical protein